MDKNNFESPRRDLCMSNLPLGSRQTLSAVTASPSMDSFMVISLDLPCMWSKSCTALPEEQTRDKNSTSNSARPLQVRANFDDTACCQKYAWAATCISLLSTSSTLRQPRTRQKSYTLSNLFRSIGFVVGSTALSFQAGLLQTHG